MIARLIEMTHDSCATHNWLRIGLFDKSDCKLGIDYSVVILTSRMNFLYIFS